ncbi:MAG: hypothetical protein GX115_01445 [Ruminiclostridium sp.]|nr:hypothetical protein [Ruminiclostridium sp.]
MTPRSTPSPSRTYQTTKPGTAGLHSMGGRFTGGQKPKNMKATITRLWKMVGNEQWKLISIFLLSTLGSVMGLIGPLLVG